MNSKLFNIISDVLVKVNIKAQSSIAVVVWQPYRHTVFESNPLQGITVCNPMLYVLLPQRGRDAGCASVRADLGPGQALGQFAL